MHLLLSSQSQDIDPGNMSTESVWHFDTSPLIWGTFWLPHPVHVKLKTATIALFFFLSSTMYCTIYPTSVPEPYPWSFNPGMKLRKGVYFTGGKNKGERKDIREWRKGRYQDWGECEEWDLGVQSSSGLWLRSGSGGDLEGRHQEYLQFQMSHIQMSCSVISPCEFHDFEFLIQVLASLIPRFT